MKMLKIKKTLCLVMAAVFAFAPLAAADDLCPQPCKVPGRTLIYKNVQAVVQPIQYEGQRQGNKNVDAITNDAYSHIAYGAGDNSDIIRPGYITDHQTRNDRVVYKICDCPDQSTYFKAGEILGIRMTILTPGVFWTDEPVAIQPFTAEANACAVDNEGISASIVTYDTASAQVTNNGVVYLGRTEIRDGEIIPHPGYYGTVLAEATPANPSDEALNWKATSAIDPALWPLATDNLMDTLASLSKYTGVIPPTQQNVIYEYFKANGTTTASAIDRTSTPVSVVSSSNQAQVLQVKGAYQIGLVEDHFNLSRWWVDIPEMRYDYSLIQPGSDVEVKIEWLNDSGSGVCGDCESICSCTFTVGTFSSSAAGSAQITFPYVISGNAPWFTGIVVSNMDVESVDIASMEAELTLTDTAGKSFTLTKNDFNEAMWVFSLDSILGDFSGGTPAAGAAILKVETNFPADGYEFLTDGNFGAGTLPRMAD